MENGPIKMTMGRFAAGVASGALVHKPSALQQRYRLWRSERNGAGF